MIRDKAKDVAKLAEYAARCARSGAPQLVYTIEDLEHLEERLAEANKPKRYPWFNGPNAYAIDQRQERQFS